MNGPRCSRRAVLLSGLAAGVGMGRRRAEGAETSVWIRVAETAGLRRFGYPVHMILPDVPTAARYRLTRDGQAVPAQFRPVSGPEGKPAVALDFNVSLGPFAVEEYAVAFGDTVQPGPEPERGLRVEQTGRVFRVSGTGLSYEIPVDLVGFLKRVATDRAEYVREGSAGFWVREQEQPESREVRAASPLRGSISRQGPLAVGLKFEGVWPLSANRTIPVAVELTFPSSKSWVEVSWTLDDEAQRIAELGLDLDLALDGSPTLVDLGAEGTVYGTLSKNENMTLESGPPGGWEIHKASGPAALLQAAGRAGAGAPGARPVEGWAHVMDATRCTAVAVAGFGHSTRDRMDIAANGRVRLTRLFDAQHAAPRTMRAWFHFVPMPVQVGAVTSPQSMLAPLKAERIEPARRAGAPT
jgi:hypothetical protein